MIHFLFLSTSIFLLSYLPGRIILSFTKLTREEKFAASFAVSFFLYFFLSFITFISPVSSHTLNSLFLLLFVFLLFIVFLRFRIYPSRQELILILIFFLGFLLILSIQSLLVYYTGGGWTFDWLEHYQRSIFFLDKNLANPYFGKYLLTARPPLFNLVASFFLSLFGRDFYIFQIVSTLLNFSVILPCFLICRNLTKNNPARYLFLFILAIFILNPAFVRQVTYTWTKAASAYFLLLGVYFYLQCISNYKLLTFIGVFILLALAYLTHYSAGPYIFLIFLHLFIQICLPAQTGLRLPGGSPELVEGFPRGVKSVKPLTRIVIAIFCFFIICLPWYSWSISRFGPYQTFLGNTSYEWQKSLPLSARLTKDFNNFRHTLIPILPADYLFITNNEPGPVSRIYDRSSEIYATTLPGNLTITLCVVLIIYFLRSLRLPGGSLKGFPRGVGSENFFWPYFIIAGIILGTIVNGKEDTLGIAHISLLPISLLLICFAIRAFIKIIEGRKKFTALLIIFFLAIESFIGTGSMIYASSIEITQKNLEKMSFAQYSIIHTHWENIVSKSYYNHLVFLADQFSYLQPVFVTILTLGWLMLISALVIESLKTVRQIPQG